MIALKGKPLFEGIAFGTAEVNRDSVDSAGQENLGVEGERQRYESARSAVISSLKELREKRADTLSEENLEIVDAHLAMLDDPDLADMVEEALSSGLTATQAIQMASDNLSALLEATGDEYIAQRAADVREIASQVAGVLAGKTALELVRPTVLLAVDLGVSTLLSLDRKFLSGIVLYNTGATSHVAIVIRSMGIPCIIATGEPDETLSGREVILDAERGELAADVKREQRKEYEERSRKLAEERAVLESFRGKRFETADGRRVELCANIATPDEVNPDLVSLADGIGLFRSEFIYLDRSDYPDEETQFRAYRKVVEAFGGKRTIIRTFDIGTDKKADYFDLPDEENPALGYRSIRICRDRKDLFETQLKALLRASAYGNLAIMIPMIISEEELDYALECVAESKADLKRRGLKFNPEMEVGIMVETPAAAAISDRLAKKAKFFSVGTNDLIQYTLAVDRTNDLVARFASGHHPAVLRLIKQAAESAHANGIPIGICGELAHDSYLLPFFAAIGIDELSMSSSYILKTASELSKIDTSEVDLSKYIG